MDGYSLAEFVSRTAERETSGRAFDLESLHLLNVNLNGLVWTKLGAMVAHTGTIRFSREGMFEHGLGRMLKRSVSGEDFTPVKAEGQGSLYLADTGKKVSVLQLQDGIRWDIKLMRRVSGRMAGGLFNVRLGEAG